MKPRVLPEIVLGHKKENILPPPPFELERTGSRYFLTELNLRQLILIERLYCRALPHRSLQQSMIPMSIDKIKQRSYRRDRNQHQHCERQTQIEIRYINPLPLRHADSAYRRRQNGEKQVPNFHFHVVEVHLHRNNMFPGINCD